MRIPDPIELMESRIEAEIDKVDADGTYLCTGCDTRFPVDEMVCMSPMGDGPLACWDCSGFDDTRQTSQEKSSVGRETKHSLPITGEEI